MQNLKQKIALNRKKLLATLRSGDYAHAGEEEAIEIAFERIQKDPKQRLLDVGCGLGGTAEYLRKNKWGIVTGIDIDATMVSYAKTHYPNISVFECDATKIGRLFPKESFEVVYSFNAFFTFEQQEAALKALSTICVASAKLVLFDYSAQNQTPHTNPFTNKMPSYPMNFFPIQLDSFSETLSRNGWKLEEVKDLSLKYVHWYTHLISKMESDRTNLVSQFGDDTFSGLIESYQKLLSLLQAGEVGGSVVWASRR